MYHIHFSLPELSDIQYATIIFGSQDIELNESKPDSYHITA